MQCPHWNFARWMKMDIIDTNLLVDILCKTYFGLSIQKHLGSISSQHSCSRCFDAMLYETNQSVIIACKLRFWLFCKIDFSAFSSRAARALPGMNDGGNYVGLAAASPPPPPLWPILPSSQLLLFCQFILLFVILIWSYLQYFEACWPFVAQCVLLTKKTLLLIRLLPSVWLLLRRIVFTL